ncbi:MAG: regulatory protein RecX [Pyrinomonadaceae bacterium]|nr:regulatory protein RecX [Pyrinomonadaceae bacterium]
METMYRQRRNRQIKPQDEESARRPLDPQKARERTLQRAVKLLAAKPRSIAELRERLLEKDWSNDEAVDAAIAKLSEYGYVNDEQFAQSFAASRVRQKPIGRTRLARDLQMKKVPKEVADAAIKATYEETPEETLIDEAISKRIRLRGRPQTREETKSLFDHLLRRGFSHDLVIRKVRALSSSDIDEADVDGE